MFDVAARFALTGIYKFVGTGWEHASGWWGVGLRVAALYAAFDGIIDNDLECPRRSTSRPSQALTTVPCLGWHPLGVLPTHNAAAPARP